MDIGIQRPHFVHGYKPHDISEMCPISGSTRNTQILVWTNENTEKMVSELCTMCPISGPPPATAAVTPLSCIVNLRESTVAREWCGDVWELEIDLVFLLPFWNFVPALLILGTLQWFWCWYCLGCGQTFMRRAISRQNGVKFVDPFQSLKCSKVKDYKLGLFSTFA